MHFEWTVRALQAGKHVLLEKPCADTADEARILFDLAAKKNLVLLEGYGYTCVRCLRAVLGQLAHPSRSFYPAIHRLKEIVDSGELGRIKSVHTEFCLPKGIIPKGDIREKYELGGGATMDLGGAQTLNSSSDENSIKPKQCTLLMQSVM